MDPKNATAELVIRHKDSSSSSSSGSSQENIVLEQLPLQDHQSFSFVSSAGDSDRQSPAGYDPNRIPSSIFSSKPTSPMDWSVASNESLFSIQMGNNSFTREQYAFMLYKSGELSKAEELCNVQGNQLPPVQKKENVATMGGDVKEENLGVTRAPVDAIKEDSGGAKIMEEHEMEKVAPVMEASNSTLCVSTHSDGNGSNHSTQSFAFPVLAPTSDNGRNCSVKVDPKDHEAQRQMQSQEQPIPKQSLGEEQVQAKASGRRWFSCFSCCPSRCIS
ncbi:hypothetical protein SLEP1_g20421 [Rubroshorea leprosula]|uniref:Uncharacterized protein n=1 Tax=Rubroshorea leprosula TaxID=152421 RepID=A0AAV5JBN3_9ROSI|nr:hypothetical protein SLEP1_g20421 [Rubroshorea leprosula]